MTEKRFANKRPQDREVKREESGDSIKNRRLRIGLLEKQLEILKNRIQADKYAEDSLFEKAAQIQNEIKQIEFTLMSREEQNSVLNDIQKLQENVNDLLKREDDDFDGRKNYAIALWKFEKAKKGLPESVRKKFKEEEMEEEDKYDFASSFEKTAHEAIKNGIFRLHKSLHEIKEKYGSLPTVVIFPETTTRPLRYAIKPLLERVYGEANQKLPGEFFVKTYSSLVKEDDHIKHVEEMEKKIVIAMQKRIGLIEEREELLRQMKKVSETEKSTISFQVQDLWRQIRDLNQHISDKNLDVEKIKSNEFKNVTEKRVENILKNSPLGPILVVDDVVARGRTFSDLEEIFKKLDRQEDTNYFAFISLGDSIKRDLPEISKDRISIGIGSQDFADSHEYSDRIGLNLPSTDEETDLEWGELQQLGFPFRMNKEENTGVKKDQESLDPFVERSRKADFDKMRKVRTKYLNWGREAVKSLGM